MSLLPLYLIFLCPAEKGWIKMTFPLSGSNVSDECRLNRRWELRSLSAEWWDLNCVSLPQDAENGSVEHTREMPRSWNRVFIHFNVKLESMSGFDLGNKTHFHWLKQLHFTDSSSVFSIRLNVTVVPQQYSPEWPPDSTSHRTRHSHRIWGSLVRRTAAWSRESSKADCLVVWGERSRNLWFLSRSSRSRL